MAPGRSANISPTINDIYNSLIAYASHLNAQECHSYPLCTEVLLMFHRNAVAGSHRGKLAVFIAAPQPVFGDKSTPDLATYLVQPSDEDGGPSRRRPGPPGEIGPWWEIKDFIVFSPKTNKVYGREYVKYMDQQAGYARQAFVDFPSRRAFYSFFSAGLSFTLLLWPTQKSGVKYVHSRTRAPWVERTLATLKTALEAELDDWKDNFLANMRTATGNSALFQGIEKRCLAQITLEYLVKVSPIPVYWRENMFSGQGQERTISFRMRNALSVAHSLTDLGLKPQSSPLFDLPSNAAEYDPTPETLEQACRYTSKGIFDIHMKGWNGDFEGIRPPDGGSTTSSNNNYRSTRKRLHADVFGSDPPAARTRLSTTANTNSGNEGVAGPGPSTLAQTNKRRRTGGR